MPENELTLQQDEQLVWLVGGTIAVFLLIVVGARFISWLGEFQHELRRLNNEIRRNTGRDRRRWQAKKRRLWLSILPFFHYNG